MQDFNDLRKIKRLNRIFKQRMRILGSHCKCFKQKLIGTRGKIIAEYVREKFRVLSNTSASTLHVTDFVEI